MSGYIGSTAVVLANGAERKKTYNITGTTTSLTGLSYTVNQVHVFHNGVRLVDGTDFTATNGNSITLTNAAESGDEVVVLSYAGYQVSDTVSASQGGTFANSIDVTGTVTADGLTVARSGGAAGSGNVAYIDVTSSFGGLSINSSAGNNAFIEFLENGVKTAGFNSDATANVTSLQSANGHALAFNTDGTTERMRIDSSGRVTMPYQPAWFAAGNAGWHTTSPGGVVPLAAVPLNRGNHYNTSGSKFTAPVAGVYHVNIMAYMDTTSQLCLKLNGSDYVPTGGDTAFMLFTNNATGHEMTSASGSIYLNAGDYIQLTARNSQSVTLYIGHSSFSGHLVG